MNVAIHDLIQWQDDTMPARVERVLRIEPNRRRLLTIALDTSPTLLQIQDVEFIEAALESGRAILLVNDPYKGVQQSDSVFQITHVRRRGGASWESYQRRRDERYAVIAPIVEALAGRLFDSRMVGRLIQQLHASTGVNRSRVYGLLRRYWWSGECRNALVPNYNHSGAPGRPRRLGTKKVGRKSYNAADGGAPGCNVTPSHQQAFTEGTKLFYARQPDRSLSQAFDQISQRYFNSGHEFRDGHRAPLLLPADQRPTLGQFYYWYARHGDKVDDRRARAGKSYDLEDRAPQGSLLSTMPLLGPGYEYQVDATIGDIYLVSSFDRTRVIGRPVLYLVMDYYSRLITGFSVGLSGPSWRGMMLALENMAIDKVEFCRELGITIEADQWPAQHVPLAALGDRGELLSRCVDATVSALDIRISNTPPWRADWKGMIEQEFRTVDNECIHWAPGRTHGPRKRGERDCRLDASMTLLEFRRYLVEFILEYNAARCVSKEVLEKAQLPPDVKLAPRDLWHWGVEHRSGALRTRTRDALRVALLPSAMASSTREGIMYKGLHYSCQRAQAENWAARARQHEAWSIPMVYDPRTPARIFLLLDETESPYRRSVPTECTLTDRDAMYADCDWSDVRDYRALLHVRRQTFSADSAQERVRRRTNRQVIADSARELTAAARKTASTSRAVKDIRANRSDERARDDAAQEWRFHGAVSEPASAVQTSQPVAVVPAATTTQDSAEVTWLRSQRHTEVNHDE